MQPGYNDTPDQAAVLCAVAEQLKLPLCAIARLAELGELAGQGVQGDDLAAMQLQARAALNLVESYLLGLELFGHQTNLELEPVSVSSLLTDVAHELQPLARQQGVQLDMRIGGRYRPVMAHRRGLYAALLSLGYSLLEAAPAHATADADNPAGAHQQLTLATHRTPRGIITGLYGPYEQLTTAHWRKALELCGRARQPFVALSAGSGAGLFVAETILQAMATRLRVGKHHNQYGLATTLQASQQLRLV